MTLAHVQDGQVIKVYHGKMVEDIEGNQVEQFKGRIELVDGSIVSPPVLGYVNGLDMVVEAIETTVDNSTGTTRLVHRYDTGWLYSNGAARRTITYEDYTPAEVDAVIDERAMALASDPMMKLFRSVMVAQLTLINEVRDLQGKASINATQYLSALSDLPTITVRDMADKLRPFVE